MGFRQVYVNLGVDHSLRTSPATQFARSWIINGKPVVLNPNFYNNGTTGGYIKGWNQGFKSAWIEDKSVNQAVLEAWKTVGSSEFREYTRNLKINLKQQIGGKRKRIDEN